MASGLYDRRHDHKSAKSSRHEIRYKPWLRCYEVEWFGNLDDPDRICLVPEAKVLQWYPLRQRVAKE